MDGVNRFLSPIHGWQNRKVHCSRISANLKLIAISWTSLKNLINKISEARKFHKLNQLLNDIIGLTYKCLKMKTSKFLSLHIYKNSMQSLQKCDRLLCAVRTKYCDISMFVATWLPTVLIKKCKTDGNFGKN